MRRRSSRRPCRLVALLALLMVWSGGLVGCGGTEEAREAAGSGPSNDLQPLPEIDAGRVSQDAGRLLRRERQRLQQLIDDGAGPTERAAAYGRLGETAQAYDFPELALAAYANARALDPQAAEWSYLRGVVFQEAGRLDEARAAFEERLRTVADPATRLRLAEVLLDLGDGERAAELFRQVLETGPPESAAAAHYGLGRLASADGRHSEAVEHLEKALELQPDAANLHSLLAMAYRRLGDREAAERHARQFGAGGVDFADPLVRRVESRIEGAGVHLEQAFLAAQDDRFEDALDEYRRALEIEPSHSTALRGAGKALRYLGRFEESLATYDRLLALDPESTVGRLERATVLMEAGRRDEAIAAFRSLLADEPDFEKALINLAVAYLQEERWAEAEAVLERALELEPGSPDALYRLALARQGGGRSGEAVEILRRLLKDTPTHVPGRRLLGRRLEAQGDLDGALTQYRAILALDGLPASEAALTHYEAGRILSLLSRPSAAEESFRDALELRPDLHPARFALANLQLRRGEYAEAAEAFRRVAEADDENVAARERELEALIRAGRFSAAAEQVERYLRQIPRSAQLGHQKARILALAPPTGVGDPAAAVELAEAIFRAHQSLEHAETLVMALAAAGRFDEAVSRQRELIRNAESTGRDDLLPRLRSNLERYGEGRPPRLQP